MLSLFNRHAAAQQSNLVINWLLVAISEKMKFYKVFLFTLMHILSVLFFPSSAEADVW